MGSEVMLVVGKGDWRESLDSGNPIGYLADYPGLLWLAYFRMSDWVAVEGDPWEGQRWFVPHLACSTERAILQFEEGLKVFRERFPDTCYRDSEPAYDYDEEKNDWVVTRSIEYDVVENFHGAVKNPKGDWIVMDFYFGWHPFNDLIWRQALLGFEHPELRFEYSGELVERLGVEACRQIGIEAGTVMTWQGALRRLCVRPPSGREFPRGYYDEVSTDLIGAAKEWVGTSTILGSGYFREFPGAVSP